MNHLGTVGIETERLILRKFVFSDARQMFVNVTSDPKVNKFLTWELHESVLTTEQLLAEWNEKYTNTDRYCWAIELKEIGEVIGNISVPTIKERTETAEVTYCLGSRWWGRGIVPEALMAVMEFLFYEVGVNRIEAGFDINNPNSGKVMEKVGMCKEGVHRQAGRNNQGLFDLVFYAILREDYTKAQREVTDGCQHRAITLI